MIGRPDRGGAFYIMELAAHKDARDTRPVLINTLISFQNFILFRNAK
jgi:hypothetical protein